MANVSTPSEAATRYSAERRLVRVCADGTMKMRAEARYDTEDEILPHAPGEKQDEWKLRKVQSFAGHFVADCIEDHADRIFDVPPSPTKDVPEEIAGKEGDEGIIADINLQGDHLDVWGRSWYVNAKIDGIAAAMVDNSDAELAPNSAEEKREGRRPWVVTVTRANLLEATPRVLHGKKRLGRARVLGEEPGEKETRWDEPKKKPCVRVYIDGLADGEKEPPPNHPIWEFLSSLAPEERRSVNPRFATFEKWEKLAGAEVEGGEKWVRVSWGQLGITYIPLVALNLDMSRDDYFVAAPPLHRIAQLDLEYFQKKSRGDLSVRVACSPRFGYHGFTKEDLEANKETGPLRAIVNSKPESHVDVVETTGAGAKIVADQLSALENRAATMARQALLHRPGSKTATQSAIDSASANSKLVAEAQRYADAVAQIFAIMWDFMGKEGSAGKLQVHKDAMLLDRAGSFADVLGLFDRGLIDGETVLAEAQRYSTLGDNHDLAKIMERAQRQLPPRSAGSLDLGGGLAA